MKHRIAILFFAGAVFSFGTPDGVPKEAKETAPGIYRLVDKDGKTWIYRKTPFGYQKSAADAAPGTDAPSPAAPSSAGTFKTPFGETRTPATTVVTKVTEDGDSLRFERPNPFGVSRWTRRKSELTEEEKKLWEAQKNAAPPANSK